ncbi:MAG: beta-ketoacyl synthase chain length factor [Flavobacteriales bacterium]|nr:beta-ketoacyl synthase chain length factor [Flavobacteriales bacterium]
MKVYINGIGNISPQSTWDNSNFLEEVVSVDDNRLLCVEPIYKEYISPIKLRRMSKVIKRGIASALIALKDANVENPGAIITGTGWGCWADTEKFLLAMIDQGEEQLTPTAFMQSTHNTVSGQIAITIQCHNYNSTYVHRGVSFERALQDGMMLCAEGKENILVGGFDECTDNFFTMLGQVGTWKKNPINNLDLFTDKQEGTVGGEASIAFIIDSKQNESAYASIDAMTTFYKPESADEVNKRVVDFLSGNELSLADIDVVVSGKNGDAKSDEIYDSVLSQLPDAVHTGFKHLCGQFDTATAFGTWLAAKMLKTQSIPGVVKMNEASRIPGKVLVINHHNNENYSLQLLSKC